MCVDEVKAEQATASGSQACRRARFRAVYHANYHRVLGYLLRRTGSREDAEDVVAETFLTAWRRLEQMPPGPQLDRGKEIRWKTVSGWPPRRLPFTRSSSRRSRDASQAIQSGRRVGCTGLLTLRLKK